MKKDIFKKLDVINQASPWHSLLSYNRNDDYTIQCVIDWFAEAGYLHVENVNKAYHFKLKRDNLEFYIGGLRKDRNETRFLESVKSSYKERTLAYFYKRNQTIRIFKNREEVLSKIVKNRVEKYVKENIKGLHFDKIFINQLNNNDNSAKDFFNL